MFVAKTLRPDAMDDSRVLIAVITPITEKTPILIPKRVRLERNLFFRIASIAIQKLSVTIFFMFLEADYIARKFKMGLAWLANIDLNMQN